jgi:hypothetical protein
MYYVLPYIYHENNQNVNGMLPLRIVHDYSIGLMWISTYSLLAGISYLQVLHPPITYVHTIRGKRLQTDSNKFQSANISKYPQW